MGIKVVLQWILKKEAVSAHDQMKNSILKRWQIFKFCNIRKLPVIWWIIQFYGAEEDPVANNEIGRVRLFHVQHKIFSISLDELMFSLTSNCFLLSLHRIAFSPPLCNDGPPHHCIMLYDDVGMKCRWVGGIIRFTSSLLFRCWVRYGGHWHTFCCGLLNQ
jgi:hypothetical protein